MANILKYSGLIALVVLVASFFIHPNGNGVSFGGTPGSNTLLAENYIPYVLYNGGYNTAKQMQIGTNGVSLNTLGVTTCSLIAGTFTVVASTTVPMDCAIAGITSGSKVFAQFATSSAPVIGNGWAIDQSSASSTAGFATVDVTNNSGVTAVIPASIASTTQVLYAN